MGSIPQLSIIKGPVRNFTPNSINRLFENVANGNASENVALIFEENDKLRQYTYSELDKITNQFARTIKQIIVNQSLERNSDGDYIVAVNMHPNDNLVMVLLAIWKAGAAYLPLDHAFPGTRIEHILKEAKPALVIYDEEDSNLHSDYNNKPYILSLDQLKNFSKHESKDRLVDEDRLQHIKDDLAIVLYTSGSTGVPKGVRLPHSVILNRLQWQFHQFPYSETEKVCVFKTALTFVDSISEIWGPLINGLSLLIISKALTKDPEKLISRLDEYKIERLVLVPSLLRSLLMYLDMKKTATALRNLKIWVCSGETLTVSLAEEFFRFFPSNKHILCNFYGSTEIMGDVTYHVISDPQQLAQQEKVPIGLPVDNTIIYLLDSDYRPVKSGQVGELYVAGLNLAAGYVNGRDPNKFIDNPLAIDFNYTKLYATGDYASYVKNTLFYEGRTDSQIKIRGHRVDLSEVENAVNSINGVDKAVVLCYRPGEIDQALLAFTTTKNHLVNEYRIEDELKEKLTSYMIPQVVIIESIPLLVNGKVDRQGLLKMYENTNNNDDSCVQYDIDYSGVTKNDLQTAKDLFECIALVLGRTARSVISLNSNYYEIGGNSLNSIVIVTQMNEKGYNLSIGDFISAANLGEVLRKMNTNQCQSTITNKLSTRFSSEPLQHHHKNIVLDMITTSFYHKADLEQWIISEISEADYLELIEALWEPLLEKNLSFIAKNEESDIIGVALNFDARDEPEVEIKSKLTIIFEFLESIEGPVRDLELPQGIGKILHSFMMATHSTLQAKENIAVMQFMESEVLKLATEKNFSGIFTTNTSPLTQQLGSNVYHYKTMLDFQVNKYIASDGTKPFKRAPDSQRAIVHWKPITS